MDMPRRPNILFIMADDHAAKAISAYGSRIVETPGIDRIAEGGKRLDHCYVTNSICTPSRASILTGTYNHVNGVTTRSEAHTSELQSLMRSSYAVFCLKTKPVTPHIPDPLQKTYLNNK